MGVGAYLTQNKEPIVQRKLTIGQPGDKYEQEADAMADQVMRMPQSETLMQRKCDQCEEGKLQMKPLASSLTPVIQMDPLKEEEMTQAKSEGGSLNASDSLSTQLNQSRGGGYGLPDTANQHMSNAFGTDFSSVKIHTDSKAVRMNRFLGARAFTNGNDIYFNQGQYNTQSSEGKHLMAHELTHVVQQSKGSIANVQLSRLRDFNDSDETHDPSNLDDATIRQTNEFKAYMDPTLVWQTDDHVTEAEALLACRLLLRDMRGGVAVDWESGGRRYLNRARMQSGTLSFAESLENSQDWNNQGPGLQLTDFGAWLLGGGPEPSNSSSTMNCWEIVMFSAFHGGFTTKARLTALYTTLDADLSVNVSAGFTAFENTIRNGPEQVYDRHNPNSPKPLPGDLVVFNNFGAHVAVAIGENSGSGQVEIMSLFDQNGEHVFRTSIERMLDHSDGGSSVSGPIRFYSPKW